MVVIPFGSEENGHLGGRLADLYGSATGGDGILSEYREEPVADDGNDAVHN